MIDSMALQVPCPTFVGRSTDLETVAAALDQARAGRGGLVLVVGEAGIGKSRLVHELSRLAADGDVVVLRGRAVPGSETSAYRPLSEALAAVDPGGTLDGPELAPWLPALAAIVPALSASRPEVALSVPTLGEAIVRLLRTACEAGALLVLEDLQWADPQTLAIVDYLSDHLAGAPVLCLATVRSEAPSPAWELVGRIGARRSAAVLRLQRLNAAQVSAMVYSCTGGVEAGTVDQIIDRADGVPFLVEELLAAPGLPASFAEGVVARLADLPARDQEILVTAASFGRHFDWRLLPRATGIGRDEVSEALQRGIDAQLLAVDGEEFAFRHALSAEAVFSSVLPPRRQVVAAAALAALEADAPDLAPGLREVGARVAERAGRPELAGRLLIACGLDAIDRGALQTAVAAFDRASALLPSGDARDTAREQLVDALASAGRVEEALVAGADLVDQLPPSRAARVALGLAAAALTACRWELAEHQLSRVRDLAGKTGFRAIRAELAAREAELALGRSNVAEAETHAQVALDLARREHLPDVECAALQLLGRCARRTSLPAAEDWFRQALTAAEEHGLKLRRLHALHELGTIALLDRSEVVALLEAQAQAEKLGALATTAILDIEIAAGYASVHDLDAASRHGLDAVRRGAELGLSVVTAYGWHHVAGAAVLRGDRPTFESASVAALAAAPGNRDIAGVLAGGCEVVAALRDDDTTTALAAAERSTDLLRGSETAPPMYTRAAWPLLLALDHRPEALQAVDELEAAGLSVSRAGLGGLTMARAVLAGRSDPDRAAALAREADEQLGVVPWWRHVVRRLAAEAAREDRWSIPDSWLPEAEEWLRSHGAPAVADACLALLRQPTATVRPAWERQGITRRESEVLELVIDGCQNREIAERLCLSVRTVEKHVESLLRKTATKTRTQLARVASTT